MIEKTCCVTGHRDILLERRAYVERSLWQEISLAIQNDYTHFISGFASGIDLLFAQMVVELKRFYDITLEAAIPYAGRLRTPNVAFQKLIQCSDRVTVCSQEYSKDCYMHRNRYMVDSSTRVIAVYDGRQTGGTAATCRYAYRMGKRVSMIRL